MTIREGVRQGDPLSPLLFVLVGDLLQTIVNKARQNGTLKHPLSDNFGGHCPILQYADDTLLILPGDARTLFNLKGLLRPFLDSTGLHVNFHKSFLVPINISEARALHLARTFGCKVGSMPFTYLGLPLGTTKPSFQEFSPLLSKIEKRLTGISNLLSYHGRLILVNSVFSALPTFYMCSLKIPPQIIKQIDIYRKHCLWSKGDINRKGSCLVAWETVRKLKEQGGLGIIDIESQNIALLMKSLDKFYNRADTPWVTLTWSKLYANTQTPPHLRSPVGSFWWKDVLKLFEKFDSISICSPNKGNSVSFWSGSWSGQYFKEKYPQLFSFTRKPKCSLRFFINNEESIIFSLPLSNQAAEQLNEIQSLLQERSWDENIDDSWNYTWGNTKFSSKKAYKSLIGFTEASPLFS